MSAAVRRGRRSPPKIIVAHYGMTFDLMWIPACLALMKCCQETVTTAERFGQQKHLFLEASTLAVDIMS